MQYLYDALRDAMSLLQAADEVLGKLAEGHQDWGQTEWEVAGPLHEEALAKANVALNEWETTTCDSENSLKITKWIEAGELDEGEANELPGDLNQLYYAAGRLLDKACSSEILGPDVVFECENGKTYCMTVEGVLGETDPGYLHELLEAQRDEE